MPGFQRIEPIGEGTIRGPARVVVAPITVAFPTQLSDIINIASTDASYKAEVQSLTLSGGPTGGTFTLSFQSIETAPIAYDAAAADIQTALNLLSSISSQGGVTCSGGPLGTTAVTITFGVDGIQPLIVAPSTGNSLTGGTTPSASVTETTAGNGQYDITPSSGWSELGSTRGGVSVTRNNTEDQLDVDQIYGSILSVPNEWEMTVATQLAETTLENIQLAWEGGSISTNVSTTPNERTLELGNPLAYTQRRLAVLHQKTIGPAAGLIRASVFRNTTRSPQNSNLDYQKAGQMQTIAMTWRAYADWTISDQNSRMGVIIEQEAA